MINVCAISDLHGYLPDIPPCDVLLLAGDYNRTRDREQQLRFMTGPFHEWLKDIDAGVIVAVAGNHDFILQESPDTVDHLPWILLQDKEVTVQVRNEFLIIYGTPWTPTFGEWAFMRREPVLEAIYDNMPTGIDILLSHGPIHGVLDKTIDGVHAGSQALRRKVNQTNPRYVVHGHIHEARGKEYYCGGRYYNVSHVNAEYEPVNAVVEFKVK